MSTIQHRFDFVYLFDVRDGNPNGDPDAGNLPRIDAETGHGLVTDVCLKRKIRNYVGLLKSEQPPYEIYVKEKAVLNKQHERAYLSMDLKPEKQKAPKEANKARELTQWMCRNFYDIRTFGAVMTTDVNCGQVRGPVQLTFSRSVTPIVSSEHTVTRCAVTTEAEALKQQGDNRTMGRKFTIPYGLYRAHGFISAKLAEQTGFSEDDLNLLWVSLKNMFDHDRSAARGEMTARKLVVFQHESALGNAPAHQLFESIHIQQKDVSKPARNYADFEITGPGEVPAGITVLELL